MSWTIYYADGTRYTDQDGTPEAAPLDGVQCVIVESGTNRQIIQGMDYYLWLGETWCGGMRADLERHLRAGDVYPGRVKFGLWINDSTYKEIEQRALHGDRVHAN